MARSITVGFTRRQLSATHFAVDDVLQSDRLRPIVLMKLST